MKQISVILDDRQDLLQYKMPNISKIKNCHGFLDLIRTRVIN